MTVIFPEFTKARGTRTVVVALDAPVAGGTPGGSGGTLSLATLNTTGNALNVSCFLYGGATVSGTQDKQVAPSRICDDSDRESLGRVKYEVADLSYGYKPQADETDEANKAKVMLQKGVYIDIVERLGLPARLEDLKVGDIVSVYKDTELGVQNRVPTGDDDAAEWSIQQTAALNGAVYHDVKIVA